MIGHLVSKTINSLPVSNHFPENNSYRYIRLLFGFVFSLFFRQNSIIVVLGRYAHEMGNV